MSVFEKFPVLMTLKGLVPDELVEQEVGRTLRQFEDWSREAKKKIKTIKLADIFPAEMEQGEIHLKNFLGHWGNMSIESVGKMALMTAYLKPRKVFEFGTYNGMTTLQIALNTPDDTEIYTLDLPSKTGGETRHRLSTLDRLVADEFRARFKTTIGSYFQGTPSEKKITQILCDSATFNFEPYYKQIDLIFIDAAHDYHNKKSDSDNALRMLANGGLIIWDNYNDVINPEVTLYLSELADRLPLYHLRGTSMVLYWRQDGRI
jgi:hypothetical protein